MPPVLKNAPASPAQSLKSSSTDKDNSPSSNGVNSNRSCRSSSSLLSSSSSSSDSSDKSKSTGLPPKVPPKLTKTYPQIVDVPTGKDLSDKDNDSDDSSYKFHV